VAVVDLPGGGLPGGRAAHRGARILVVDDQPVNVHLLVRVLQSAGFHLVHTTTNPYEAADLFVTCQPDLVLLDLHMPGLDGFAVMDRLRLLTGPDDFLPIVVITADATSEARSRALASGANDFLTKPFERTEVLLRIGNLLDTRALHRRLDERRTELEVELQRRQEGERRAAAERAERAQRVRAVIDEDRLRIVYQPIVDLARQATIGVEALSRIEAEPRRGPDAWFAEAAEVGLEQELEVHAARSALRQLRQLRHDVYLSVNLSPRTLLSGSLDELLGAAPWHRVVLELTEHTEVVDYEGLHRRLAPWRQRGVRVAVDDAGAGHSSLRHILRLRPDIIKLDRDLVGGIDRDPVRRALSSSLVAFARELGGTLVAEGVENGDELDALVRLGIPFGQGYHLGRPGELAADLVVPEIDLRDLHQRDEPGGTAGNQRR
jgi:EAL domain-containing protein (putative c-di-GMP-specific phosphodiesterase class I)/FixJ family two-component response regulator